VSGLLQLNVPTKFPSSMWIHTQMVWAEILMTPLVLNIGSFGWQRQNLKQVLVNYFMFAKK
jgi:hypothetical protein